ncbi:serine/threonine-protein kinase [Amycolatopsis albispora]|uniref:non-specific serine/threonine protein kinase n=1 Tax=Amycolatopsis albispora TaxID=1804986 RepID=A0A344LFU2_9PSEU|nr:serine/threonine-protein kinase [Amycolatopsis albispora]AXB46916.1 serine/threonine protein kinase [Amycolatopsis albispora]
MSDEGRLVAGRYRIVQKIGTGAMGAVWQAHDEVLARTVAIKQLLLQPGLDGHEAEDARQRTMREGRIAARLHHPNAITVFDVVTDDNGQPCLIMEYLNSTSLAQVLHEHKTLPPMEVARIGAQIAAALKEAHAVGIVHRDIKPGNILIAGNGHVKITDFGISRAKDDVTVTKTGMIAGTPAYLAPEVAIGGDPGPESDVFSLGSTLYAACEGQPPFGLSENTLSLLHAVAAGQINPPRQSGPMASVLAVMLHPEIGHRPTAEECEELLDAVARGETPLGGPADTTHAVPAAALGAGAVAGALGTKTMPEPDELSGGYSGTLSDAPAAGGFYDNRPDDGYPPADGYPDEDYDSDQFRAAAATTVAAPTPVQPYPDDDGYDYQPAPQGTPPPPADERKAAWKKPAAIGGIVLVALIALGVWIFLPGDNKSGDADPIAPPPAPSSSAPSSTESSVVESSAEEESSNRPEPPKQTSSAPPKDNTPTKDTPTPTKPTTTKPTTTTTKSTPPEPSDPPPTGTE